MEEDVSNATRLSPEMSLNRGALPAIIGLTIWTVLHRFAYACTVGESTRCQRTPVNTARQPL